MKDKITNNQYDGSVHIQGECLSFAIGSLQTGIFTPYGETFILQPNTVNLHSNEFNGVSAYGYTTNSQSFVLNGGVLIESHTEPTTTGRYEEKLYILSSVAGLNSQPSLFSNATTTLTNVDLGAIQVLAQYLTTFSVSATSLTVQINFSGSEEKKMVVAREIENALKNHSIKNKLNWIWQDYF